MGRRDPMECASQAKARLGDLGKGKTGPRAGVPSCSRIDAANKLLRVPTGTPGRNFTDFQTGFSRMARPKFTGLLQPLGPRRGGDISKETSPMTSRPFRLLILGTSAAFAFSSPLNAQAQKDRRHRCDQRGGQADGKNTAGRSDDHSRAGRPHSVRLRSIGAARK